MLESPNKENISYIVDYMKKNANLSDYFSWLANEVSENGTEATRTIIYCQTIKQCALVYTTIKILLGEKIYEDPMQKDAKRVLLEMLHSCTPTSNKDHILESFQSDRGCVRILVATIAFGMGVDCKQVHRTIHFGPAKNVEAYMLFSEGEKRRPEIRLRFAGYDISSSIWKRIKVLLASFILSLLSFGQF